MAAGRAGTVGGKAGQSAPGGDVGDLKNKVLCPLLGRAFKHLPILLWACLHHALPCILILGIWAHFAPSCRQETSGMNFGFFWWYVNVGFWGLYKESASDDVMAVTGGGHSQEGKGQAVRPLPHLRL